MSALKQSQNSKQLKTKLAKLEAEYKACQGEIAILQRRNSTLQRDIEALEPDKSERLKDVGL